MDPRIERFLSAPLAVGIEVERPAEGPEIYAAWPILLPGCISQGSSRDEARARLKAILPAYLETMMKLGNELPDPDQDVAVIVGATSFYDDIYGENLAQLGGQEITQPPTLKVRQDDNDVAFQLEQLEHVA